MLKSKTVPGFSIGTGQVVVHSDICNLDLELSFIPHEHSNWLEGDNGYHFCSECGYYETHDWSNFDGVCTKCQSVCSPHDYSWGSTCSNCGMQCPHENLDDFGNCTECHEFVECPHSDINEDGYCTSCGEYIGN